MGVVRVSFVGACASQDTFERFPFGVALFGAALARFGVRVPALGKFCSMVFFWLFQPSARRGVCAASASNSASSDTDACQYDMLVFQRQVD